MASGVDGGPLGIPVEARPAVQGCTAVRGVALLGCGGCGVVLPEPDPEPRKSESEKFVCSRYEVQSRAEP